MGSNFVKMLGLDDVRHVTSNVSHGNVEAISECDT